MLPDRVQACDCRRRRLPLPRALAAFTLIELLLSITILTILMVIVTNVISVVQKTWVQANSRVSAFREARGGFDTLVRNLSQATLNTYWQSVDPLGNATRTRQGMNQPGGAVASAYVRQSELQFVSGRAGNSGVLGPDFNANDYPGHAVFFQAPLGITRLAAPTGALVDTENLVNLLCGRGYFVAWGDDAAFRPAFLSSINTVRPRFRYRLMEFSPTAEKNQIYRTALRPVVNYSKQWFQDSLKDSASQITDVETAGNRAPIRPVADNVICLVIAPLQNNSSTAGDIAPQFEYDSLLIRNPGSSGGTYGPQGTQHLLPPLIKVTMIVVDSAAGEKLAEDQTLRLNLASQMTGRFLNATNFDNPNSEYRSDLAQLEAFLVHFRLNYRVFTSTVIMKQARWSA